MTDKTSGKTDAPSERKTPARPGQPGSGDKRRSDPAPHSGPANPPYSSNEPDEEGQAEAIKRDETRKSTID